MVPKFRCHPDDPLACFTGSSCMAVPFFLARQSSEFLPDGKDVIATALSSSYSAPPVWKMGQGPSFATFWRNSQNETTAKELKFVQSVPGQPSNKAERKSQESEQVAKSKRRAQVRKAQVQHRQRKADYVRQLEDNIAGIRDKIADAEGQRQMLRSENEAIRAQLSAPAGPDHLQAVVVPEAGYTPMPSYLPVLDGEVPMEGFDLDPSFDLDYFPMDPNMSDYVNATTTSCDTLDISSGATSGTGSSAYGSLGSSDNSSPYPFIHEIATDQPQQIMNLFLA